MVGDLSVSGPSVSGPSVLEGPRPSVGSWRARRGTTLVAYDHQDLPFEKLVEELGLERDLSRNPLFQVVFALQNVPVEALSLGDLETEVLDSGFQSTRFDLEAHFLEGEDVLHGFCAYDRDLFDATTVRRWLLHFGFSWRQRWRIRRRRSPSWPGSRSPSVTNWPKNGAGGSPVSFTVSEDAGAPTAVHERIRTVAERTPDAVAVADDGEVLSYAGLARRAHGVAHRLVALGVGPERVVAVCLRRSTTLVAACLGVAESGAAYLPMDPVHPARRLRWMVRDPEAEVLIATEGDFIEGDFAAGIQAPTVLDPHSCGERATPPRVRVRAENPAYLIYTSGSTGRPKGVVVPHGALRHLVAWHLRAFALTSRDRCSQLAGWASTPRFGRPGPAWWPAPPSTCWGAPRPSAPARSTTGCSGAG